MGARDEACVSIDWFVTSSSHQPGMKHSIHFVLAMVGLTIARLALSQQAAEVELSKEDAIFVRSILQRDELVKAMVKAQKELSSLHSKLEKVPSGPVKIALKWDQAALKTWRLANKSLDELKKATICDEIQLRTEGGYSTNPKFFEQLFEARGCDRR